ncbi:MAG TPA: redox-sensing transcriptional repressor Rex [Gemmatimonadaceae bacterium]|nr:redox-sensing transcriptional repressor Rex [Gemmatimonadaceae bacterium]
MKRIADSTVRRLSLYLRFLEEFETAGLTTVSSGELAARGGTTSAQVRKDLSFFGSFGKRGLGYQVAELTQRMRRILGLERDWRVIIVGVGKIGAALAQYEGFRQRGFRVVGLYDADPDKIGREIYNLPVHAISALAEDNRESPVDIAVIAVPAAAAQRVVDDVVAAGILGIMSFAPIQLHVPPEVTINTVNMAMELERLSYALSNRG